VRIKNGNVDGRVKIEAVFISCTQWWKVSHLWIWKELRNLC